MNFGRVPDAPYAAFSAMAVAAIALLYLVPLIGLVLFSVGIPGQPSLEGYAELYDSSAAHRIILTTFRIALVVTVLSVVLGYFLALGITHLAGGARSLLIAAVVVPFWLSSLIRAIAWIILLRNNGVVNETLLSLGLIAEPLRLGRNETGVIIAMVHFCVPFAVFSILGSMLSFDKRLIMAGQSLGASRIRVWWDIHTPLMVPAIVSAGFLVFVLSLGFFVTPAMVGGGRVVMLSEFVSLSVLVTVRWTFAAALSVFLLVATVIFLTMAARSVGLRRLLEIR